MTTQPDNAANHAVGDVRELNIDGLINSVLDKFDQYYVYPDIAARMRAFVSGKLGSNQYKGLDSYELIVSQVAHDLQEISGDGHIAAYPTGVSTPLTAEGDTLSDQQKAESARRNYGFQEVKRLAGNIGYLKFNYFEHPSIAGPTAEAAMQFLANSNAVIIDLRDNSGGEEGMVQFLLSYFFEGQTHLLSFYNNKNELTEQSWTYSHVPGKKLGTTDLTVLISGRTGSGAEAFAYDLQCRKRAILIGETTKGIAHMVKIFDLPDFGVRIHVPYVRPASPITNGCWEKVGVKPDIETPDQDALAVAYRGAVKRLMESCNDEIRRDLEWILPLAELHGKSIVLSDSERKQYSGVYDNGRYSIVIKNGTLYWRYSATSDYALIPITTDLFGFADTEDDRLQFVRNDAGVIIGFQLVRKSGGTPNLRRKTGEL
jgi:retinol-binding protein 3